MRYRRVLPPVALLILLLVAWLFRWEQGPEIVVPPESSILPSLAEEGGKVIHTRDRWTGQAWITKYGPTSIESWPQVEVNTPKYLSDPVPTTGFGAVLGVPPTLSVNPDWQAAHDQAVERAHAMKTVATGIWTICVFVCFAWATIAYRGGA